MELKNTILLVGGQKGGDGKTTTAVSMAILRKRQGRDVLLIDGDAQKSASNWAARRGALELADVRVPCISLYGDALYNEVKHQAEKYQDIVIDVAGHKSKELLSAMRIANRMVTPVQASQFDLDTLAEVDQIVDMMKSINPDLDATWFVNRVPTNVASAKTALENARYALEDLKNLRPLSAYLSNRSAFDSTGSGYVINETPASPSRNKGILELQALFEEVWK